MAEETQSEVPVEIEPCKHIEKWVNGVADGSLKGPARWYTQLHAVGCPQCRAALQARRNADNLACPMPKTK